MKSLFKEIAMKLTNEQIAERISLKLEEYFEDGNMEVAAILLKRLDAFCDKHDLDFPVGSEDLNVELDEYFNCCCLSGITEAKLFDLWFKKLTK
jgi:hypothetical protein